MVCTVTCGLSAMDREIGVMNWWVLCEDVWGVLQRVVLVPCTGR